MRTMVPDGFIVPKNQARTVQAPKEFPRWSGYDVQPVSSLMSASTSAGPSKPRPSVLSTKPVFNVPPDSNTKKPLRVLKPPNLAAVLPPESLVKGKEPARKPMSSLSSFRPVQLSSTAQSTPGASSRPLRNPLYNPPTIPRRDQTPLRELKPLPPPPVLAKRKPDPAKPMVSILKTSVARATDIHTEAGTAELLAIYLQTHGTGYVDPVEREMTRGLEQSPEKRSKARKPKYIRYVSSPSLHADAKPYMLLTSRRAISIEAASPTPQAGFSRARARTRCSGRPTSHDNSHGCVPTPTSTSSQSHTPHQCTTQRARTHRASCSSAARSSPQMCTVTSSADLSLRSSASASTRMCGGELYSTYARGATCTCGGRGSRSRARRTTTLVVATCSARRASCGVSRGLTSSSPSSAGLRRSPCLRRVRRCREA